jgi:hypothetical protein
MNKIIETIIERGLFVIGGVLLGWAISNKISEHDMAEYHKDRQLDAIHVRLDEINNKLDNKKYN